jgi:class 3 adenylate cyclase
MNTSGVRKLAAIMFTDMVGYTALMQQNEQQAKRNRDRHRQVLNSAINANAGTILQYYGDGTLSIFNSAVEAVTSAVQIQQQLQKEPKVPLRIGIHTGDVVHDDEGIYGDGVNIASRVESMAVSGSVLISGKVFDEIKNHTQFETKSYGPFQLKNVEDPVKIYGLIADGCVTPGPAELKGKGAPVIRCLVPWGRSPPFRHIPGARKWLKKPYNWITNWQNPMLPLL